MVYTLKVINWRIDYLVNRKNAKKKPAGMPAISGVGLQ